MALEHESDSALALAVRKAGSQTAFGRLLGKRQSTVRGWLLDERPLPAEYVLVVEWSLGIPRHVLRPDLYPPEEYANSAPPCLGADAPASGAAPDAGAIPSSEDPLAGLRS